MTPVFGCMPVCLFFLSLGLLAFALVVSGVVKDVPPDPNAPPPEPSTFPGWRVALFIAGAVGALMWILSEIAAPG
ncbi:MAG TPA: hypothetical protein VH092_21685 [Urbifossiella sp.]|jgi:hypothetical protein|nr:hypothetical protein [Urbifossiella sp.]